MTSDLNLILASKSRARQAMLQKASVDFDVAPAAIDEPAIIAQMLREEHSIEHITQNLAQKKALSISKKFPENLVIGSDQSLEFEGEILTKADNDEQAKEKLRKLRGKTHALISAVSVTRGSEILWEHAAKAKLTMHDFDDSYLDAYCEKSVTALTSCVGAYEYEAHGSWLFSSVQGEYYTILGMPLLPLLNYLRESHGAKP